MRNRKTGLASWVGPSRRRPSSVFEAALLLGGVWYFCVVGSSGSVLAQEPDSRLRFPFGIMPALSAEALFGDRQTGGARGLGLNPEGSRPVFGPGGEIWRYTPSLTGGWITDSSGNSYRVYRGLNGMWVTGPRWETWRISPKLGGGARIFGPSGENYTFQPGSSGGGWIIGPRGESWRVTPRWSGSFSIQ